MLVVALTGGIATGKSIVAGVLEERGCFLYRADIAAHRLMAPQKPAWRAVVAHFGEGILKPDGSIDRKKLGTAVFSKKSERLFLNELIHPLVNANRNETVQRLKKEGRCKIFVSEAALTIESGYADFFDKIIVVYCPKETQIVRLVKRDHISREEALRKLESQMPSAEKLKYADYIIDTSGTIKSTVDQAGNVHANLLLDYQRKKAG